MQGEGAYTRLDEPVRVFVEFQPNRPRIKRLWLCWHHRRYEINKVHLYHTDRHGETLLHYLSVTAGGKFFKLRFDSKRLTWTVEEVFEP